MEEANEKEREFYNDLLSYYTQIPPHPPTPPPHTHTHSLSPQCFLSRRPLKPSTHKHTRSSSSLKQRNIQTRLVNNRTGLGNNRNPLSAAFLGIVNKLPKRFFYVSQSRHGNFHDSSSISKCFFTPFVYSLLEAAKWKIIRSLLKPTQQGSTLGECGIGVRNNK